MSQLAQDLLHQARLLARHDQRRPRAANLRRAISAAYYALFHHHLESGSILLLGTQRTDWPLVEFVTRAFDHGAIKAACRSFTQNPPSVAAGPWSKLGGGTSVDLQFVAHAVMDLQEERHDADYNLSRSFTAWEHLRQSRRDLARLATLVMLLWKQIHSR